MNQIPSLGADTAIAPRTGSGSPQSTPQQRADAAPTVVADSPSARADPGVTLKVVPPPMSRDDGVAVQHQGAAGDSLLAVLALLRNSAQPSEEPAGSATDPDQAVASRVARFLASLPPDIQLAIQSAKTPELAKLIRLAAMTAPGIRDAPAILVSRADPLAHDPLTGMHELMAEIESSAAFRLSAVLRELVITAKLPTKMNPFSSPKASAIQASGSDTKMGSESFLALLDEASVDTARPADPSANHALRDSAEANLSIDAPELQQAVKDGLRLLMDGRLIWQGELLPGSFFRFERSDVWGASAGAPGGMEKGTAFKVQLNHPELGLIELRALGLGGQVAIRLFGNPHAVSKMLGGLPEINESLRRAGLAGAQVSVEPS